MRIQWKLFPPGLGVRSLLESQTAVDGTRKTTTVNPGILGNDQPLVLTREFWYSDELQTNLSVTRIDPRIGKQVIRISNISQSSPTITFLRFP